MLNTILGFVFATIFLLLYILGPEDTKSNYMICSHIYIAFALIISEIQKISK